METTTLGAIYTGRFTNKTTYRIYVICAGDIPLYVGKSRDAAKRVLSHLRKNGSIFDFEVKTLKGWENFLVCLYECEDHLVDCMEENLIYDLSPVYNSQGKQRSRENAERWRKLQPAHIANQGTARVKAG